MSSRDGRSRSPSQRKRRSRSPREHAGSKRKNSDRHQQSGDDREHRKRGNGRACLPVRPRAGRRDSDDEVDAVSFDDFRRLKRLKLAEQQRYLIWGPSPSPSPEPEPAAAAGSSAPAPAPAAKLTPAPLAVEADEIADAQVAMFVEWLAGKKQKAAEEAEARRLEAEANMLVGPSLPAALQPGGDAAGKDFGVNMRPGEGERMAAYVNSGKRIPRRGEVGMSSEEITHYEEVGYVMSGSRHNKMNAVRIRKENQVYTAEEKQALAMFNAEEAKRKEEQLMAEMKSLVSQAIGEGDAGTT